MSVKIYVGNIPTAARNSELKDLFEKFGKVTECDILKDFGFVHMDDTSDAKAAIAGLHDTLWKGSRIRVEISTTRTNKGEPSLRKLRALETRDRYGPRGAPPPLYRESYRERDRRSPAPYREPRPRYDRERARPYPDYDPRGSRLPPPPPRDYRSPPPYERDPYASRGRYLPPPPDPYYRGAPLPPPPPPPHIASRYHRDMNEDRLRITSRYRSRSPRSRTSSPPPPRRRVESPRSRDFRDKDTDGRRTRERGSHGSKRENNSSYTSSSSTSSL